MERFKLLVNKISSMEEDLQTLYKQLEQDKREMLNVIADTTPDFIAIMQNEKFIFINPAGQKILKYTSKSDILGKNIYELIHPDFHEVIRKRLRKLSENKSNDPVHIKLLKANGKYADLETSSTPFTFNNAQAALIAGRDISTELLHKQNLENERNLREVVLNSFTELIAFYDTDHKIKWMNDAAKKEYNIQDDSYIGGLCHKVRFNSDKPCCDCPMLANKNEIHERTVSHNGVTWSVRHTPILNSQGVITGYIELSRDITLKEVRKAELKEAEENLRESEQRFREIFENSNESIFLLEVTDDMRFRNLDCNPAFERSTGLSRNDLVGKYTDETVPEEGSKRPNEIYRRCAETGEAIIDKEIEIKLPIGTRYYRSSIIPIPNKHGKIYRILGMTRDISDRKQLDELLRKKQTNLEEAQRIGKIGSWELNMQNNHIERSDELFRIYEMSSQNGSPSTEVFISRIHPADRDKVLSSYAESVKNRIPYSIEYRLLFADGRVKYVLENCETHYDEKGNPIRSIGIVQDITERKLTEELLRKREMEFRTLAENAPDPIYRYDKQCRRIYVNPVVERVGKIPIASLLGKTPSDGGIVSQEESMKVLNSVQKVLSTGERDIIDVLFVFPDGREIWTQNIHVPEFGPDGSVESVLSIGRDITERKRNEQQLKDSFNFIEKIINSIPEPIFIKDREHRFVLSNDAHCQFRGLKREEILDKSDFDLFPESDARGFWEDEEAIFETGKETQYDDFFDDVDGNRIYIDLRKVSFTGSDGKKYLAGIIHDITDRKKAETILQEERKLFIGGPIVSFLWKAAEGWPVEYVSPNIVDQFGYSPELLTSGEIPFGNIIHPEDFPQIADEVSLFTEKGCPFYEQEYRIKRLDGEYRWIHDFTVVSRDENGTIKNYKGYIFDITTRKLAEKALLESEEKFSSVFRLSPASLAITRLSDNILLDVNEVFLDHAKLTREQVIGKNHFELNLGVDISSFEPLRTIGNVQNFEYNYLSPKGSTEYGLLSLAYLTIGGEPCVLSQSVKITDIKNKQKALMESEQRYRLVFENSPVPIWEEDMSGIISLFETLKSEGINDLEQYIDLNPDFVMKCSGLLRVVDVNQAALSLHKASNKDELIKGLADTFNSKSYETFKNELICIWNGETSSIMDTAVNTLTGEERFVTVYFSVCPGYEKSYSKVLVSLIDITERKKVVDANKQLNSDLNATLQAIPDMLFEINSTGVYLNIWAKEWNLLLMEKERLLGKSVFDILPEEAVETVRAAMEETRQKGYSFGKIYSLDFHDERRWFELSISLKENHKESEERFISLVRDITDRKIAENRLKENQKRLTKAELVASIGHLEYDFTNGLSYWSEGAHEIFNIPEEMRDIDINFFLERVVHQDDSERLRSALENAVINQVAFDEIYRIIDLSGAEKIIHGAGQVLPSQDASPGKFFGIIQDITLMYNLNAQLFAEEEKFRFLAENSPLGIFLSANDVPVYLNKPLLKMIGIESIDDFARTDLVELIHPDDRIKALSLDNKLRSGSLDPISDKLTIRKLDKDSTVRYLDIHIGRSKINDIVYLQCIVVDITEDYENEKIKQQLAANTLYLEQKSKFACDIESTLKVILSSNKKFDKVDFQPVIDILKSHSLADKDWDLLKTHIDNIHPEFVAALKKYNPTLSVNDIKHCQCIRLNFDTKEIARFFNVKPSSIQTSRVRLKKKLGLQDSTDLREFIISI